LALLSGCATPEPLPPLTATASGERYPGKFVWFDLLTEDPETARRFYGAVFGWTFEPFGEDGEYHLLRNDGVAIGGVARVKRDDPEVPESLWLPTLSVEDVDAATVLVKQTGGEVVRRPENFPGRGRLAAVRDPVGAGLLLLRSEGGDPPDGGYSIGGWLWTDLWTREGEEASSFYAALVGYQAKDVAADEDHVYRVFGRDGRARAGLVVLRTAQVEDNWLPYVRVADLEETLALVETNGGRVVLRRGGTAVIEGPTGAAVGVQQHRRLAGGSER
jgi:predicted enzyme related to lactoylglutathione lyase